MPSYIKYRQFIQMFLRGWKDEQIVRVTKEETNKCISSISSFSHLFAPICFGLHLTIIRVLDIKEYNTL